MGKVGGESLNKELIRDIWISGFNKGFKSSTGDAGKQFEQWWEEFEFTRTLNVYTKEEIPMDAESFTNSIIKYDG